MAKGALVRIPIAILSENSRIAILMRPARSVAKYASMAARLPVMVDSQKSYLNQSAGCFFSSFEWGSLQL
ncbi:MAG TPA: hypothetical protein DD666_09370 [Advenella kashmirensis]|uniref:Uncharacterized protein n=1 Tax=Advenella kashmirensis TaxID=310575 RepID=A0A356LF14_9BURK|nr:hypothetical protein [Advenella kashmirensis]